MLLKWWTSLLLCVGGCRAARLFDCFSCLFFLKWAAGSLSCFEYTMNRNQMCVYVCASEWEKETQWDQDNHTVTFVYRVGLLSSDWLISLPASPLHPPLLSFRKWNTVNFQLLFLSLPSGSKRVGSTCVNVNVHCSAGKMDLLTPSLSRRGGKLSSTQIWSSRLQQWRTHITRALANKVTRVSRRTVPVSVFNKTRLCSCSGSVDSDGSWRISTCLYTQNPSKNLISENMDNPSIELNHCNLCLSSSTFPDPSHSFLIRVACFLFPSH